MARKRVDVAVVGGGPAGLSAAIAAAEAGAATLLVEAQSLHLTGQIDRSCSWEALSRRATVAGIDVRDLTAVWGIFPGNVLGVIGPDGPEEIGGKRIVLATGARRISEPAPGWSEPDIQLVLLAECAAGYSATLGGWVPGRTGDLVTSNPAILVAGDGAGLCPVPVAEAEGRLAGLHAAADLGYDAEASIRDARELLEGLAPERLAEVAALPAWHVQGHQAPTIAADVFAASLAGASSDGTVPGAAMPGTAGTPGTPETVVCSCEGVTAAEVSAAIAAGARSLTDVKRRTRAGMGVCQGALCGRPIAHLIARQTGLSLEEIPPMTARPPVRLARLRDLASVPKAHASSPSDAGVHSG